MIAVGNYVYIVDQTVDLRDIAIVIEVRETSVLLQWGTFTPIWINKKYVVKV